MESLHPLLKIIPEYKPVDSKFMLCGAILPKHWARLQLYAERIRIATTTGHKMCEIHSSVWPFLAARARGAPLMPRLRKFNGYAFATSGIAVLPLLLSPTLRILEIYFLLDFEPDKLPRSPHVSASLLQTLPLMVPDLEHFIWGAEFYLTGAVYLQSLTCLKKLKLLATPAKFPLDESDLQMVSSITSLQSLSCHINLSGITAPTFPPRAFQGLTSFTLHGNFDYLVSFILACEFPNLEASKFHIKQPPSAGKPQHLWTAMAQRFNHSLLTSFEACYTYTFPVRPSSLMECLGPLLTFPNITSFGVTFFGVEPSIHDDDLARFGAAWPRLATFKIEHCRRHSQPDVARPTLSGIIELARRCPALTTLYIPEIDPSPMAEKSAIPVLGHRLRSVWIDCITPPVTIQMYMDVAAVVDRVFPWIDLEDPQNLSRSMVPGKAWVDILRFIRVMRIGRENGAAYTDLERRGS